MQSNSLSISPKEYAYRRRIFVDKMGESSIAIIPSAREQGRNGDTFYRFRQSSHFHYLCGFDEPSSLLVIAHRRGQQPEFIMFCRDKNAQSELWNGAIYGPSGVLEHFGADAAFPIEEVDTVIPQLIEGCDRLFYSMGSHEPTDRQVLQWMDQLRKKVRAGISVPHQVIDPRCLIDEMRLIKSNAEIKLMQRAADISARAHICAIKNCRNHTHEYQLQADIEHQFSLHNAQPAYSSIVGSGDNACTLHYIKNDAKFQPKSLVLIDAGAEYNHYAADVSRTFPVEGTFTEPQRQLYKLVLEAQLAAIDCCHPGNSFIAPHNKAVQLITKGLLELGLLTGNVEQLIKDKAYSDFFPHRTGHWLGMDVHDTGSYKVAGENGDWRTFQVGMVTTIEPGIYVQPNNKSVGPKWRGIGVRIEDDVLITDKGPLVITDSIPKSIEAIEALMTA